MRINIVYEKDVLFTYAMFGKTTKLQAHDYRYTNK